MKSGWLVHMKEPANFAGCQLLLKTVSRAFRSWGNSWAFLALIVSPDLRNSWGFPPKSKLFYRKVFHPTVVRQPLFRRNLLILKLMWQFVLNRVEQIFRCMFMSGSNGGGGCAN